MRAFCASVLLKSCLHRVDEDGGVRGAQGDVAAFKVSNKKNRKRIKQGDLKVVYLNRCKHI